jgi:gliding motility-associated-like protein
VTLHLIIQYNTSSILSATSCSSYIWNGQSYTISGVYSQTYTNTVGCDSIATLFVTILNTTGSVINKTSCNSYTLNIQTYFASGIYTQHFINAAGCDSSVILNLTINPIKTNTIFQSTCHTFLWNGQLINASGLYSYTFSSAAGCDSIVILNATILNTSAADINQSACNSFSLNGLTYTISGTYIQTLSNTVGCDSLLTLKLTIHNTSYYEQQLYLCYGKHLIVNNHLYDESGDYTDTLLNVYGCDSILLTHLNIEKSKEGGNFIANAFSPNGDGLNDCFGISYWKDVKELTFMIYNRWGNPVFETKELWDCWNGNYKGGLSEQDTYYYLIKAKTSCGEKIYKGDLLLIR